MIALLLWKYKKNIIDYTNNMYEQNYSECIENALGDINLLTL